MCLFFWHWLSLVFLEPMLWKLKPCITQPCCLSPVCPEWSPSLSRPCQNHVHISRPVSQATGFGKPLLVIVLLLLVLLLLLQLIPPPLVLLLLVVHYCHSFIHVVSTAASPAGLWNAWVYRRRHRGESHEQTHSGSSQRMHCIHSIIVIINRKEQIRGILRRHNSWLLIQWHS